MRPQQSEIVTVVTDGRAFGARAGGVQRYAQGLFHALAQRADARVVAAGAADAAALPPGVMSLPSRPTLPTNLGWCASGLPWTARGRGDVFHAPAYTAPLWGAQPLVLTIHDVSYARAPHWYPYHLDPVRLAFFRRSATRADHIVTDSLFSLGEIVAAYGVSGSRITAIPLGVDPHFVPGTQAPDRRPYVLHVGDLHVRRQLDLLLDLVLQMRTEGVSPALQLVLVGRDFGQRDALMKRAHLSGHADALVHYDRVSESSLVQLYQGARVLLHASRYEGFGLPVLEAMACGTPVLIADAGSLPEVAGDAGLVLGVDDRRAWTEALRAVLRHPELAGRLADAGLRRASLFTWTRVAEATMGVYRAVIGRTA